jgi:hypothetical protein
MMIDGELFATPTDWADCLDARIDPAGANSIAEPSNREKAENLIGRTLIVTVSGNNTELQIRARNCSGSILGIGTSLLLLTRFDSRPSSLLRR